MLGNENTVRIDFSLFFAGRLCQQAKRQPPGPGPGEGGQQSAGRVREKSAETRGPLRTNAMKLAFLLLSTCCALFLTSCADNSLMTDEEYRQYKGPAPFSPDPAKNLPGY
jgi:hypothetical protein